MGQARERERGELREEKMGRRGKERKEKREEGSMINWERNG